MDPTEMFRQAACLEIAADNLVGDQATHVQNAALILRHALHNYLTSHHLDIP